MRALPAKMGNNCRAMAARGCHINKRQIIMQNAQQQALKAGWLLNINNALKSAKQPLAAYAKPVAIIKANYNIYHCANAGICTYAGAMAMANMGPSNSRPILQQGQQAILVAYAPKNPTRECISYALYPQCNANFKKPILGLGGCSFNLLTNANANGQRPASITTIGSNLPQRHIACYCGCASQYWHGLHG
jgi:hypothetical protein